MSNSRGMVIKKGYDYMKVVFGTDQDGLTTLDHTWVDEPNDATVFSRIPCMFESRTDFTFEKAQICSSVKTEEWKDFKEVKPINHNDVVKIMIEGQEQKALWNSNIESFVDYNSMNPIESELIFWKKA